jgi:hypothetical protein
MEGSEVNKIVVDAYSSASKALKTVRIESNVTAESVETAMEMFEDEVRFNQLVFFFSCNNRYERGDLVFRWIKCKRLALLCCLAP